MQALQRLLQHRIFKVLFKWGIAIISLVYLVQVMIQNLESFTYILAVNYSVTSAVLFALLILLMFANWMTEAIKWRKAIASVVQISSYKALASVWTGMGIGVFTPNRIGELAGRGVLLNKEERLRAVPATAVCSFSQMLVSLIMGVIGFSLYSNVAFQWDDLVPLHSIFLSFGIILLAAIFAFVFRNRLKPFVKKQHGYLQEITMRHFIILIGYSVLRYAIFLLQYNICLHLLGVPAFSLDITWGIMTIYLLTTIIPSSTLGEIGIRGSVAVFILSEFSPQVISIISASFLLWFVNLCIPALAGLFLWKKYK